MDKKTVTRVLQILTVGATITLFSYDSFWNVFGMLVGVIGLVVTGGLMHEVVGKIALKRRYHDYSRTSSVPSALAVIAFGIWYINFDGMQIARELAAIYGVDWNIGIDLFLYLLFHLTVAGLSFAYYSRFAAQGEALPSLWERFSFPKRP